MRKRRKKLFGLTFPEFFGAFAAVGVLFFLFNVSRLLPPVVPIVIGPVESVPVPFARLSLTARAAYVWDTVTGRTLYQKNGDAQLPLASLTKIMTAVSALSLMPEDTIITLTSDSLAAEGDSGLRGSERWRLGDLLAFTLVGSSNDGADAVAAAVGEAFGAATHTASVAESLDGGSGYRLGRKQFVAAMNTTAKELGLTQTYFLNPTGLDETPATSGGYGSARDAAVLFSHALKKHPRLFGATRHNARVFDSLNNVAHRIRNTNTSTSRLPSLLGSKTGYTDLAGGNLVIAFDAGPAHPIVVSVLGSTEEGRFEDVEKLVWATLDYLANQEWQK